MTSRVKMAVLTWALVYPLITGLQALLGPLLEGTALPLRTFILSALMVPTLVLFAMPFATRVFARWLNGQPRAHQFQSMERKTNV